MGAPASAQVITFRPRMGRPSKADDLALELAARQQEETEWSEEVMPRIRRLQLMASGPVARATVAEIEAAMTRHQRRWTPTSPEAA
jgi:hypothetical protein